jgi:hypothetical protein
VFPIKQFYLIKMDAQPDDFPTPMISQRAANERNSNLYFDAIIEAGPCKNQETALFGG